MCFQGTSDPYVVIQLDGQDVKSKVKWGLVVGILIDVLIKYIGQKIASGPQEIFLVAFSMTCAWCCLYLISGPGLTFY